MFCVKTQINDAVALTAEIYDDNVFTGLMIATGTENYCKEEVQNEI